MRSKLINAVTKLVAALLFLGVGSVWAQAVVRDVVPSVTSDPVQAPPQPSSSSKLFYQLQNLQQEIMELRGLVEEQAFELKRLKQQRLDDYLDLDKRIVELSKRPAPSQATAPAIATIDNLDSAVADENTLYNQAINRLLDEQDYAAAQEGFQSYLKAYPEGLYAANVYYWQGQIYLTEGDTQAAQDAFIKIVDQYPEHQKTPDAKFKLAKIYFDEDKKADAKVLLDDVAQSNSDVARLAKTFLENNF